MKLKTDSNIVYRIPRLSFKASLKDSWEALKLSMADSSPEFYHLVKYLSYEELQQMDDSYKYTVWKYFNRARYRATPYGSFAGLGTARLSHNPSEKLIVSADQELHRFMDWTCKDQINVSFNEMVQQNVKLQANSTYYLAGDRLRYICFFDGIYEIAELPVDEVYLLVLKLCRKAITFCDICTQLPPEINGPLILESMYNDQLLLTQYAPNIIGEDYFHRINFHPTADSLQYIIAERKKVGGAIDQAAFKHLPALVERLHRTLPSYEAPELTPFINSFRKRFGDEEVSLMAALDPELGLGYGGLDNDPMSSELITQLKGTKQQDDGSESTLRLLLPQLMAKGQRTIDLEQVPFPGLTKNKPLPNSLPVLCSESNGILQIEHIGGATANSLLGRFTLAMDDVQSICRINAQREQEANPEVLFFDIGYITGNRIDNVNRRKRVYDYQLAILNYDDSKSSLAFEDILVSVRGNELHLRSAGLNKRLVPRLATAYNYLLSDLPAFRLLCDLQHQGTHKNLYLRLIDRIPGLPFYPRVQFRNIILSPATWRISFKDFEVRDGDFLNPLKQFFANNEIESFVRVGKGDQTLCIDIQNSEDLKQLWTMLSRNGTLHLEETLIPINSKVNDETGKPYMCQYMLSLYHEQELYRGIDISLSKSNLTTAIEQKIMPGREWLYYEIYCHQIRANEILTGQINNLLQMHQAVIKNWFFIRYAEDGDHIRLRIRVKEPSQAQAIMADLVKLMEPKLKVGLIADIRQRTYNREIGRYGSKNMEIVETHFEQDSNYVLALLKLDLDDTEKYKLTCRLLDAIQAADIMDTQIFRQTLQANLESFEREHGFGGNQYKQLNVGFQAFKDRELPLLGQSVHLLFSIFADSFVNTLKQYQSAERAVIFTSLLHMHINRLFPEMQRTHEAVIYYFIDKDNKKKSYAKPQ